MKTFAVVAERRSGGGFGGGPYLFRIRAEDHLSAAQALLDSRPYLTTTAVALFEDSSYDEYNQLLKPLVVVEPEPVPPRREVRFA